MQATVPLPSTAAQGVHGPNHRRPAVRRRPPSDLLFVVTRELKLLIESLLYDCMILFLCKIGSPAAAFVDRARRFPLPRRAQ